MAIDDCPYSFQQLAAEILPAHMDRMRQALSSPHSMVEFGTRGIGEKTILKRLNRRSDFSGCYVLLEAKTPLYVGISRTIVQRLCSHVKGADYYTATLAYRMAVAEYPNRQTANQAMKDAEFMRLFAEKKEYLKALHVAFIEMTDPVEMYLFEAYCAMQLDTSVWNTFRTH